MIPVQIAIQIGGLAVTAVALVVTMKVTLNGMQENVRETRADVKKLLDSDRDQDVVLAGIHAEQEATKGWLRRLEAWLVRHQVIIDRRGLDA